MAASDVRNVLLNNLLSNPRALDAFIFDSRETETDSGQWCSMLFEVLFDVHLEPPQALALFSDIAVHREELQKAAGRPFDFRVAALDHMLREGGLLQSPKVLELQSYQTKVRLASTDELTGLFNRRFLEESIVRELHRSRRYHIPFSILFLDIDNFKSFNDSYGHLAGDEVLRNFSRFLTTFMRAEDSAGRFGGEEFILVMPQTDTPGAMSVGARLLREIQNFAIHPREKVTFSGGIATFPVHGETAEVLIENADLGLYHSKIQGKNQISTYPSEKRRSPRYPGEYLDAVRVTLAGVSADREPHVRNMSASGAALEIDDLLEVGDTVELVVETKSGGSRYEVTSQVIWVRKLDEGPRYCVGTRYSKPQHVEISGFVRTNAS